MTRAADDECDRREARQDDMQVSGARGRVTTRGDDPRDGFGRHATSRDEVERSGEPNHARGDSLDSDRSRPFEGVCNGLRTKIFSTGEIDNKEARNGADLNVRATAERIHDDAKSKSRIVRKPAWHMNLFDVEKFS